MVKINKNDITKQKKERRLYAYDPNLPLAGIPMGQRSKPYTISGTDVMCSDDDLHFTNNFAMQQMWDDIRRTCIVGIEVGYEATPETINYYLEVLNHALPRVDLQMKAHPAMVDDFYLKVFTGYEVLQDEIDKQFVINIDNEFPNHQAKQIKTAIGRTLWQIVHIPTDSIRTAGGQGACSRMAKQIEETAGRLAFTHLGHIDMSEMTLARSPGRPRDLCFCHMADIVQTSRKTPDDPCNVVLEVASAASVLYQIRFGSYIPNAMGYSKCATPVLTNDVLDDFLYFGADYVQKKYRKLGAAKANIETVKDISATVTRYGLEMYKKYSTAYEDFNGSQMAMTIAIAAGCSTAMATGSGCAGLSALYLSMEHQKKIGGHGDALQDQCRTADVFSIGSDEGCICEPKGPNYQNYAKNVGYLGGYAAITAAAHAGRNDAFCLDPLIKTAFADDLLYFDFGNPRGEFARGVLGESERM